ncbi:DUF6348 family protein [Clostridium weizhouense]|uniref:Uncharacterized protein n=1 Tax=Clostridium weizhouense TaxID=2859781 RepID=A0ABS7ATI5_9CLOT|nr:DUF6348 family protein [Clostridium weizhouense]MBW6410986.1 hypothetical protein [Clostridium weizhouense]
MGIFNKIFNRSNKSLVEKLTNDEKVLEVLNRTIEDSEIDNGSLHIKDIDLTIGAHVAQVNKGFIQVIFILKHKIFDEDFIESVAGIGNDINTAIEYAVASFSLSSLCGLTHALKDEDGEKVKIKYCDKINEFKLYKSCLTAQGTRVAGECIDYWDLLGYEIKKRLGNKKVYYIKIYASKTGESINCECRINGKVNIYINEIINKHINEWKIQDTLYSEKQFFVLIQVDSTYTPYKFTQQQISNITMKALDLYKKCDSQERYENLYIQIFNFCNDITLANDLFCFIPEIFCELLFPEVKYSEKIILLREHEKIELFKEQLMSYYMIYNLIQRTIKNSYYEKDELMNIVSKSASFNVINQALNNGSEMKDLCMNALSFNVVNEYKIF